MIDDEALKSIEKLHEMKAGGIISDEEFALAKQKLLQGQASPKARQVRTATPIATPADDDYFAWAVLPLRRYAEFEGRSRRKEFWLFYLAISVVGGILLAIRLSDTGYFGNVGNWGAIATILLVLGLIGILLPVIALQVRRLHDQDKSGWFVLLNLIPYIGAFAVLILMAMPGTEGENRYGPDPLL